MTCSIENKIAKLAMNAAAIALGVSTYIGSPAEASAQKLKDHQHIEIQPAQDTHHDDMSHHEQSSLMTDFGRYALKKVRMKQGEKAEVPQYMLDRYDAYAEAYEDAWGQEKLDNIVPILYTAFKDQSKEQMYSLTDPITEGLLLNPHLDETYFPQFTEIKFEKGDTLSNALNTFVKTVCPGKSGLKKEDCERVKKEIQEFTSDFLIRDQPAIQNPEKDLTAKRKTDEKYALPTIIILKIPELMYGFEEPEGTHDTIETDEDYTVSDTIVIAPIPRPEPVLPPAPAVVAAETKPHHTLPPAPAVTENQYCLEIGKDGSGIGSYMDCAREKERKKLEKERENKENTEQESADAEEQQPTEISATDVSPEDAMPENASQEKEKAEHPFLLAGARFQAYIIGGTLVGQPKVSSSYEPFLLGGIGELGFHLGDSDFYLLVSAGGGRSAKSLDDKLFEQIPAEITESDDEYSIYRNRIKGDMIYGTFGAGFACRKEVFDIGAGLGFVVATLRAKQYPSSETYVRNPEYQPEDDEWMLSEESWTNQGMSAYTTTSALYFELNGAIGAERIKALFAVKAGFTYNENPGGIFLLELGLRTGLF